MGKASGNNSLQNMYSKLDKTLQAFPRVSVHKKKTSKGQLYFYKQTIFFSVFMTDFELNAVKKIEFL